MMPGLVPGIHVLARQSRTWMAGTKPGHGEKQDFKLDMIARSEADEANQTLVFATLDCFARARNDGFECLHSTGLIRQ